MKGRAYAIIGRPGAGKTTIARRMARAIGAPLLVFDTNAEWGGGPLPDMDTFIEAAGRARGRLVIFEDATVFFTHARHQGLTRLLIGKRHAGNVYLLLFHSLRQVPLYVLDMLNGIVVLKTNDQPDKVAKRFEGFPHVVAAFEAVRRSPSLHASQYVGLL